MAIIRLDDCEWMLSGNDPSATNNQKDLHAPAALALPVRPPRPLPSAPPTDSQYLRQGITELIAAWGWKR